MKNFFKTSLYLAAFAIAGILFQISCSNSDDSSLAPSLTGKLLYYKATAGTQSGIFTCDYDGTNETPIPITLPANYSFSGSTIKFSADGQKIFFFAGTPVTNVTSLFSCDADGNNLQPVLSTTWPDMIELGDIN